MGECGRKSGARTLEVFPYIILFNFFLNAKSATLNSTPNFVDLQYVKVCINDLKLKIKDGPE